MPNKFRCLAIFAVSTFMLIAPAYATVAPTVITLDVLFGFQSFNLIGSSAVTLPWDGINGVRVSFSAPITSATVSSLSGVSSSGISGLGTSTLTWNFAPLSTGAYSFGLAGTGADKISSAGGDLYNGAGFTQTFQVLVGDVNQDGQVDNADVTTTQALLQSPYSVFGDINGDGSVNIADVQLVSAAAAAPPAVPEPTTISLMCFGIAGLAAFRRCQPTQPASA